ncbi:hypothetical protein [Paenibacillus xylanivorans]|nr:hypothetical protein [Paenibacillus xylanivorans]
MPPAVEARRLNHPKFTVIMLEWGLMEGIDPAKYIDKTIEIERFTANGSLAIKWEFLVTVFLTDGKPIGGIETVLDINVKGMFTLDGKTLLEVTGKSFAEWQREWLYRYGGLQEPYLISVKYHRISHYSTESIIAPRC